MNWSHGLKLMYIWCSISCCMKLQMPQKHLRDSAPQGSVIASDNRALCHSVDFIPNTDRSHQNTNAPVVCESSIRVCMLIGWRDCRFCLMRQKSGLLMCLSDIMFNLHHTCYLTFTLILPKTKEVIFIHPFVLVAPEP